MELQVATTSFVILYCEASDPNVTPRRKLNSFPGPEEWFPNQSAPPLLESRVHRPHSFQDFFYDLLRFSLRTHHSDEGISLLA
jgi:hypothetical protein